MSTNRIDSELKDLLSERRKEVEALQKDEADHLKTIDSGGRKKIEELNKSLPKDINDTLKKLDKNHKLDISNTEDMVLKIRANMEKVTSVEPLINDHPGFNFGPSVAAQKSGWLTPYYATIHGSNGKIFWQGYNPGNINAWDSASGSGSGIFGTGAASFTVYIDWWFNFQPELSKFYSYTIHVPYHGFYILYANDGFWDSKRASAKIDLCARGYQYNWKPKSCTNIFAMDSQNINVNSRIDGWRTMNYSDLLGGVDFAYLLLTTSLHVYARGGGSHSELNFSIGSANYIGVPWVYVH